MDPTPTNPSIDPNTGRLFGGQPDARTNASDAKSKQQPGINVHTNPIAKFVLTKLGFAVEVPGKTYAVNKKSAVNYFSCNNPEEFKNPKGIQRLWDIKDEMVQVKNAITNSAINKEIKNFNKCLQEQANALDAEREQNRGSTPKGDPYSNRSAITRIDIQQKLLSAIRSNFTKIFNDTDMSAEDKKTALGQLQEALLFVRSDDVHQMLSKETMEKLISINNSLSTPSDEKIENLHLTREQLLLLRNPYEKLSISQAKQETTFKDAAYNATDSLSKTIETVYDILDPKTQEEIGDLKTMIKTILLTDETVISSYIPQIKDQIKDTHDILKAWMEQNKQLLADYEATNAIGSPLPKELSNKITVIHKNLEALLLATRLNIGRDFTSTGESTKDVLIKKCGQLLTNSLNDFNTAAKNLHKK